VRENGYKKGMATRLRMTLFWRESILDPRGRVA
jgi:hypothetical protein